MSGRRRPPEPAIPMSRGSGEQLAAPGSFLPPEPPVPEGMYLASTEPGEAPPLPDGPDEPHHLVDPPLPDPEPEGEELSPEEEVMFASLLTCGRRSKTIVLLDHVVMVQSLNCDDDLRIGLFAKDFTGTAGEQRAYQIAVAAAGLRSIDGQPFVQGLFAEVDEDALFDEKIAKVKKMYPTVVSSIYRAVLDVEKEFVELATRLGKLSG